MKFEDYYKIEQMPPQGLPQKYLLVYFLGNAPVKYREKINILADKLGLEVVELSELKGTKYKTSYNSIRILKTFSPNNCKKIASIKGTGNITIAQSLVKEQKMDLKIISFCTLSL